MARTLRIKPDTDTHYHLMSRINNKKFLFKRANLKRDIVRTLKKIAFFSGIAIDAYCIMDDHFHLVCTVKKPEGILS
jgi:REP element-mobilizing transposase RayT